MAQMMNEQQRSKALEEYNPKEHLITVAKDKQTGQKILYYPAAWRLYELHLRYTNANFKSEIIYHDEAKGTVIVKAYLYLGVNYEQSEKKAEAMKQGSFNILDKVETAAKARCARDFGIGTEYALDMTADETDATHDDLPTRVLAREAAADAEAPIPINAPTPRELRERHKFLQMNDDFDTIVKKMFKRSMPDDALSPEMCIDISGVLERFYEKQAKSA